MQGVQKTTFTDHESSSAWFLPCQEASCGHRTCEDMLFLDIHSQPLQLCCNIASCSLTVVGQKHEWNVSRPQFLDKAIGSGDQLIASVNDSIHVNQIAVHENSCGCLKRGVFKHCPVAS